MVFETTCKGIFARRAVKSIDSIQLKSQPLSNFTSVTKLPLQTSTLCFCRNLVNPTVCTNYRITRPIWNSRAVKYIILHKTHHTLITSVTASYRLQFESTVSTSQVPLFSHLLKYCGLFALRVPWNCISQRPAYIHMKRKQRGATSLSARNTHMEPIKTWETLLVVQLECGNNKEKWSRSERKQEVDSTLHALPQDLTPGILASTSPGGDDKCNTPFWLFARGMQLTN